MSAPRSRCCRRTNLKKVIALLAAGAVLNVTVAWGWMAEGPLVGYWPGSRISVDSKPTTDERSWLTQYPIIVDLDDFRMERDWCAGREWINARNGVMAKDVYFRTRCGWPRLCLEMQTPVDQAQSALVTSAFNSYTGGLTVVAKSGAWEMTLPARVVWPGFAINTLFYAGVLWMLFAFPFVLRRMIRRRRGQCPACAYPIGTSEVCTECGAHHAVMPAKAGIQ